mgnify:CR=1 FL=1
MNEKSKPQLGPLQPEKKPELILDVGSGRGEFL